VTLWIDCGQIEVKRLARIAAANPAARVIVVKATGSEAALYARAAARLLPPKGRGAPVMCLGFDDGCSCGVTAACRPGLKLSGNG
jgi:hypothetical protein